MQTPKLDSGRHSRPENLGRSRPRKIYIVEDHPAFREGLTQTISGEEDLQVCGTAGDANTARAQIARLKPDIVLIDISLPGKSGLELIKEIRATDPEVKLLVISMHDEALYANRVLRIGGDGYIMKEEGPAEIIEAIRDVLNGHIYLSEAVLLGRPKGARQSSLATPAHLLDRLTDQDLEILELLGLGKTTPEIARETHSTTREITSACAEIRHKLALKHNRALLRYAVCWVETGRTDPRPKTISPAFTHAFPG
jgi:DNA-binding NarL/FixJ family response regulator